MAEVPEIDSIFMHGYSDMEEEFYEECPWKTKKSLQDLHWGSCSRTCLTCNSGITMEVTEHRESLHSFKKAVVLVIAVDRMKKISGNVDLFSDMDLLDLLHVFAEEEISHERIASTVRAKSPLSTVYKIKDAASKCLALQEFPGEAKLVALYLQGHNIDREQKIQMEFYRPSPQNGVLKQPVTLGLKEHDLYLSCAAVGDTPELRLESLDPAQIKRFTFFKNENSPNPNNSSTQSFESAAFPNWYISTSQNENEPVVMSQKENQTVIMEFNLFKDQ
ncbi:interleukin-1 beta [Bombina bombina]|uniref:interleukin-1 beta n=1 Tax=Bombina bombina TaxID=8345 RepID=UPI00235AFEA4|nr:interleukin-1 beta [Bombina bombina]XP_053571999.1 interleukin-1 beta [Bombina bombina]